MALKTIEFSSDGARADWLLTPEAVRHQTRAVYEAGLSGQLAHFTIDKSRIDEAARLVCDITRKTYPDLVVPPHSRWRHFDLGGKDRWQPVARQIVGDKQERARIECELAITSVLLDAGAGALWSYHDPDVGRFARSEGLALASLNLFVSGAFSSNPDQKLLADAAGLSAFSPEKLAEGFQVRPDNPLEGLEGRTQLIASLGDAVTRMPKVFGETNPRLGNIADYLISLSEDGKLPARMILITVLHALGRIWPGRIELAGRNLGDTWPHQAAPNGGLLPFHKLSQWLSYSLFEPLQRCGIDITGQSALTGLAEYRNGGLFIDTGVLVPRDESVLGATLQPSSECVVEWRALSVALLDEVALRVRATLELDETRLPLASVLQGGTWAAGRLVANEKRKNGPPPIEIESDGSVF